MYVYYIYYIPFLILHTTHLILYNTLFSTWYYLILYNAVSHIILHRIYAQYTIRCVHVYMVSQNKYEDKILLPTFIPLSSWRECTHVDSHSSVSIQEVQKKKEKFASFDLCSSSRNFEILILMNSFNCEVDSELIEEEIILEMSFRSSLILHDIG